MLFDGQAPFDLEMYFVITVYPLLVGNLNELADEASGPTFQSYRIKCPVETCSCKQDPLFENVPF